MRNSNPVWEPGRRSISVLCSHPSRTVIENITLDDKHTIQTTVAIVGGGLSGMYAAKLLQSAGIDFKLFEARDRLGGRVLSVDDGGLLSGDGFDLGASWFWPKMQPQLAALVQELGLRVFAQHNDGDVIFERMSRERPGRYRATYQEPESMRLAGGTGTLINALAAYVPDTSVRLNSPVTQMALHERGVLLSIRKPDGLSYSVAAKRVIAALPPRLLATVSFTPGSESDSVRRWRETPTWMAPHAKFIAVYDEPFWRAAGLSGTAQSMVGPLAEIHDATTASGKPALLAFVGMPADQRLNMGEACLTKACVDQLARLYGPQAGNPHETLVKDWATDPYTATAEDRIPSGHPTPSDAAWVTGPWQNRLSLAGSETSDSEPGYLAGAIRAAERAVSETMRHS
jgi:monoamine oxidase